MKVSQLGVLNTPRFVLLALVTDGPSRGCLPPQRKCKQALSLKLILGQNDLEEVTVLVSFFSQQTS